MNVYIFWYARKAQKSTNSMQNIFQGNNEIFSQCVDANSQLPLEGSGLQFCCDTVYDATP